MKIKLRKAGRLLACLVMCLAIGATATKVGAQTHYKPHIFVGAKAGVSQARLDLSPHVPQSWLLATNGAITFRYTEEKLFGILAELGWSQRGWKENFEESPLRYERTLTYVNLPILTQIIFGAPRAKCFINLGPQIAFMVGENIKSNFDYFNLGSVTDWPERQRRTEQLAMPIENKFDYGIAGGIGGEVYILPRHSITVEARYYFGLGNIFRAKKSDVFSASRCTAIEVTLGYNFRLK